MLQAAKARVKEGIDPLFDAGNVGHNREGIPPMDYKNVIFIVPTITVQPKPDDFKGTDMKWAIQQFTDWVIEAQEQLLGPEVSLILLQYRILHHLEPEAMKNVVKHLKGMQSMISKHINNFCVNTKMAGSGQSYPMYLKLHVSINVSLDSINFGPYECVF
jgi:hypothetical protein